MERSAAEQRVWEAFPSGEPVHFGDGDPTAAGFDPATWGPERTIRAEVLMRLMLGAGEQRPGYRKRIWIAGAKVTGVLDLNATVLDCEFIADSCYFDSVLDFGDAQTRTIELPGSRLAGLNMWDMRVDGGLSLYNVHSGRVILSNSRITGDLKLNNATVHRSAGEDGIFECLAADGIVLDGNAYLNQVRANGSVNLRGARISGSLELHQTELSGEDAVALDLELATISGHLFAAGIRADSWLQLSGCSIAGTATLSRASLRYPSDGCVLGNQMRVGATLDCAELTAEGSVDLYGADIGKDVVLADAVLTGGDLVLSDARLGGGLDLQRARLEGRLNLAGTRITGPARLDDARVTAPPGDDAAASLRRAVLSDDLFAPRLTVHGGLDLFGTVITGHLVLTGADLIAPAGGVALDAQLISVGEALDGDGLLTVGGCVLTAAKIGNAARFAGAIFAGRLTSWLRAELGPRLITDPPAQSDDEVVAFDAWTASIGDDLALDGTLATGTVVLAGASVAGQVTMHGSRIEAETALDAAGLTARGGLLAEELRLDGFIDLRRADLALASVRVTAAEQTANLDGLRSNGDIEFAGTVSVLSLEGARIGGNLVGEGLHATDLISLLNAEVVGDAAFPGARIGTSRDQLSFLAVGARFGKNLAFGQSPTSLPTHITGAVLLGQATVQQAVSFAGVEISGSLDCSRLTAASLFPPADSPELSIVALDGATIGTLGADLARWPSALILDGLTYTRIETPLDARAARRWLGSSHTLNPVTGEWRKHYVAQPFQQLAGYLRGLGDDSLARQVLLWQQRAQRPQLGFTRRLWAYLMDGLAGYGYVPGRALLILLGSWLAGWAWFSREGLTWRDGLLVLDMIIPTSPFGLEDLGRLGRADLVVASILVTMGWLLSLSLLPAVTRAFSRN